MSTVSFIFLLSAGCVFIRRTGSCLSQIRRSPGNMCWIAIWMALERPAADRDTLGQVAPGQLLSNAALVCARAPKEFASIARTVPGTSVTSAAIPK
jgi:hypothetical protein